MSIQENKATTVALNLRKFYDTYFETNIDQELENYKYYYQKLQEETEKINISNNISLILRDKGEEKLLSEKDKINQIITQKEKGFKRMQDENTILIAECNRLRKNLHEVYMHVVDIERKFEELTKINPTLNKTEIVNQIKVFIKETHDKIKSKYDNEQNEDINYKNAELTEQNSNYNGDVINNINQNDKNFNNQNNDLENINVNFS